MKKLNCFLSTLLLCSFITSCGNNGTVAKRKVLDTSSNPSAVAGTMSTVVLNKVDPYYGSQYTVTAQKSSACAANAENLLCAQKAVVTACNPSISGCYPGQTYNAYQNFSYYNECSAAADSASQVSIGPCSADIGS
jgi:hypothetical protein